VTHSVRRPPAGQPLDEARELPSLAPSPEAEVAASQRRALVQQAIRELPVPLRQVLTLALEGLANREMGDVLGLSENAVAIRLTRARQALRQRLAAGEAAEPVEAAEAGKDRCA
jgi:RNA polymerase sigma-70 factor (ECF subfamily)